MRAKTADRLATVFFWILGMASVAVLLFIVGEIFAHGISTAIKPSFFLGKPEVMKEGGGILPMIVSSIYLAALTLLISLPLSLGAAIYLSEYSRGGRIIRVIRFCADSLSSLPSIVFGLFGLAVFVVNFGWGYCLLSGAFTLALLNLPTLMRSAEESLKSVPQTYREASLSLGASRWTTVRQVVVPSALPGILTGTILSIGRIMGESAALVFTTGTFIRKIPLNPFQTAAPLAVNIWYTQSEALIPDYRNIVNGGAAFLLFMVIALNIAARYLGKFYRRRKGLNTIPG